MQRRSADLCPYYVPSPRPESLFFCDSQGLLGAPTIPTPEERLDLCTTVRHTTCPIYVWTAQNQAGGVELGQGD